MMRGRAILWIFSVVVLLSLAGLGRADYTTGFETSDDAGYIVGNTILGVDGWDEYGTPATTCYTTVDSSSGVVNSGTQAFRMGIPGTSTTARSCRDIPAYTEGHVTVSLYMAANSEVTSAVAIIRTTGSGTTAAAFGFGDDDGDCFKYLDDGGYTYTTETFQNDTYYHFLADVDMDHQTYDLTITGPGVSISVSDIDFANEITSFGGLAFYKSNTSKLLYADDISITRRNRRR